MNELIPIADRTIGEDTVQTANARELHAFLESKQDFSTWIKKRIADYGFQEGIDFVRFDLPPDTKLGEVGGDLGGIVSPQKNGALESTNYKNFGQQGRIEYAITLDMAKELAMVERNKKGRQARRYFIECERRLKLHEVKSQDVLNEAAILRVLVDLTSKVLVLDSKVDRILAMDTEQERVKLKPVEQAPKVQPPPGVAPDRMASDPIYMTTTELSKRWQISANTLRNWRFKGVGPHYFKPSGRLGKVLYKIEDIEAWERERTFVGAQ